MNFTTLKFGAAIAATATAASLIGAPAQALTVSGNPDYNPRLSLPTTLTVSGEFANINNPALGFSGVSSILVNSLVIKAGSSIPGFNANYDGTTGFLTGFLFDGQAARLNLLAGNRVLHTISSQSLPGLGQLESTSTVTVLFDAVVERLDGFDLALVSGNFNAVETFLAGQQSGQSFSLNVTNRRAIPTPALVPAALGFGAAMLRKRKGEKAEKEVVGAKA